MNPISAKEFNPVTRNSALGFADIEKYDPLRELAVICIARKKRSGLGINFSHDVR